jgi:quercetin dioxygenase-like cupin family protein
MTLQTEKWQRPLWTPLPQEGCINVSARPLLSQSHLHLALLRFEPDATIHEHAAEFDIDVICLEGSGFTSVGEETAPFQVGEKVRWPANINHRLWTTDSSMTTLMVEHTNHQES